MDFGRRIDEQTSIGVFKHAVDIGVNFIDTADVYDRGQSEEFVGKAVKGKRSQVIIATKFASPMGEGPNDRGGSRYHIMEAVEASLKRLQTDYIDLYQIHRHDPTTPIEETLRALDDLVRAGKVRYIGCSNFAAWQLCEALWTSEVNNLESFVTVQPQYNLLNRRIEQELAPCCQAYGVGVIPAMQSRVLTDGNFDMLAKLEAFAAERGHSMGELAIAWLLSRPWLSTVIAGATKIEQVSANVAAAGWKLTPEEVAELDQIA
jgi:aryl-alcohol dehydrogenase-like predicted oxidoreductase